LLSTDEADTLNVAAYKTHNRLVIFVQLAQKRTKTFSELVWQYCLLGGHHSRCPANSTDSKQRSGTSCYSGTYQNTCRFYWI